MLPEYCLAQQTGIATATTETTIVTADAAMRNDLVGLLLTSKNAAVATLTLRDGTAGTIKAVLDYPATAAVITTPVMIWFTRPLKAALKNSNWTAQLSANASGINITAFYTKSE